MSFGASSSESRRDNAAIQPKVIRFVSSNGMPHAKRRRINAACQTCRKRKTRCSGERPMCKTCTQGGHSCGGYSKASSQKGKSSQNAIDVGDEEARSNSIVQPRRTSQHPVPSEPITGLSIERPSSSSLSSDSISSGGGVPSDERQSPPPLQKHNQDASGERSPASSGATQIMSFHNRVPYFRYFGPTAIVPGFKQMVVSVRGTRQPHSDIAESSAASMSGTISSTLQKTPSTSGSDSRGSLELLFYDANDSAPVSSLVKHLCDLFFNHLGCSYPFLQRERFLRDLEEKRVDAILVDAVCALGARFSNHPLLATPNEDSVEVDANSEVLRAFRGHPFSQRAMSAVIDTFAYPTVAVAQATLLLAYDEFGNNHDSGLWMYLGTSIRMAQDIGMHKLEGLRLEGRVGPTPKTAKRGPAGSNEESEREEMQTDLNCKIEEDLKKEMASEENREVVSIEDRRAIERERIDTFYAIFFLDRVVSSGLGRSCTLRDEEIEVSFPFRPDSESVDGWPPPFPPLIRIIHLYGRAADILNGIKDVQQVTPETLKRLAMMEKDLTSIYSGLSPRLHFNAVNFQHYVKAEQGTNFILLHFWFHTLIVLLHQPTLLHSFGGKIQQLFSDSRELSMSSAKTIADILAFAELIDAKSFIGNPFTTQPIYVAACAFLAEVARYSSAPSTRGSTPPADVSATDQGEQSGQPGKRPKNGTSKNTLLASAANSNYQHCYKALQALDQYWRGTRYILTALDQKSEGVMDPLLYTHEDVESAIEVPQPFPKFSSPGWRRSVGHSHSQRPRQESHHPRAAWTPPAFGISLSGTMNSPNPNLSLLYSTSQPPPPGAVPVPVPVPVSAPAPGRLQSRPAQGRPTYESPPFLAQAGSDVAGSMAMLPTPAFVQTPSLQPVSDAGLLLGLPSPATVGSTASQPMGLDRSQCPPPHQGFRPAHEAVAPDMAQPPLMDPAIQPPVDMSTPFPDIMMIESQDIDVANDALQSGFALPTGEMIPWLEYLPQDVLSYFNESGGGPASTLHGGSNAQ